MTSRTLTLFLASSLFSLPLALAAEPGGDAPSTWDLAAMVSPGVYEGSVGGADPADWYRVASFGTEYLNLTVTIPEGGDLTVEVRRDEGAHISFDYVRAPTWDGLDGMTESILVPAPLPGVRVGVWSTVASQVNGYALEMSLPQAPDFAVTDLEVTPAPVPTDAGPLALPTLHMVSFNVTNLGADGDGTLVTTAWTTTDGTTTELRAEGVQLQAGETRRLNFTWNAAETGTLGDAYVTVLAEVWLDPDWSDNSDTVRVSMGVSGVGLTAGGDRSVCQGYLVGGCVGISARGARFVAWESVSLLVAGETVWVSTTYGAPYAVAYVYAVPASASAYVAASHGIGPGGFAMTCVYAPALGTCRMQPLP